jgi:hypothetical protein
MDLGKASAGGHARWYPSPISSGSPRSEYVDAGPTMPVSACLGLITKSRICSGIRVDGANPSNFAGLATSESADVSANLPGFTLPIHVRMFRLPLAMPTAIRAKATASRL